jgi:hypothetical protein
MVYTEIKKVNGREYFYRVLSIRKDKKISKRRIYLGKELSKEHLVKKENEADDILLAKKKARARREVEKIKKKIVGILRKNKVVAAGIFGSYARGENRKNSDVDILIQIDPKYGKKISFFDIIGLKHLLEEKLGRKIDLVEYNTIKSLIRDRILNEEVKII